MQSTLTINIGELDKTTNSQIVTFDGEFDKAGHMDIKEKLDATVKNFQGGSLIFDFLRLKFINSEGIGYLMEIHAHLVKIGKRLVIVSPNAHTQDVFEAIGINEVIPVYKDLKSVK